jgi:hypothetical protein
MTTSLAADLPHRVNELKLSKNQSIYTSLKLIYEEYTKSLLDLQTEFVAAGRLADSKSVQSEFFLNTGYLKLNGKSYQFIFNKQKNIPEEANIYRNTRNEKIKIVVKNNIIIYINELKKAQSFYINSQNLRHARKASDEMRLATLELEKLSSFYPTITSVLSGSNACKLLIKTKTGNTPNSKSDSIKIHAFLITDSNEDINLGILDNKWEDNRENRKVDTFGFSFNYPISKIKGIELKVSSGIDAWKAEYISFQFFGSEKKYKLQTYQLNKWFSAEKKDRVEVGALNSKKFLFTPQVM